MSNKLPEESPFVQNLEIPARWIVGTQQGFFSKARDTDNRSAVFGDSMWPRFIKLTAAAKDMVLYIIRKLPYEQDYMEMVEEKYMAEAGVSRQTFHTAKRQLDNWLIARRHTRRNTYWVNPNLVFKGDRTKKFPDKLVMENEDPLAYMKQVYTKPELSKAE